MREPCQRCLDAQTHWEILAEAERHARWAAVWAVLTLIFIILAGAVALGVIP